MDPIDEAQAKLAERPGLRRARQIAAEAFRIVRGENDSYAKGWRDAAREIQTAIADELKPPK